MRLLLSVAAALLSLLPVQASADVVTLVNGDRISGKVVGPVARRVRLQTPYGVLVVPREMVRQVERADGKVEVVNAPLPPPPPPPPPPEPEPARLHLVISGDSFWQAWDPKAPPADPSLRLELRLEDLVVASYTDKTLDPEDLPKAVVNSFVFSPQDLAVGVAPGVVAGPPVVVPGEVGLPLKLPAAAAGVHRLRIAYRVDDGTAESPRWRDVVTATTEIDLRPGATTLVQVKQSRGTMEYSRRKMHNVETFTAMLQTQTERAEAP